MDRKQELQNIIHDSNVELWDIMKKEYLEKNMVLAGRCFKRFEDDSRGYRIFIYVRRADEYGNLWGEYYKIYENGNVEFSCPQTEVSVDSMVKEDSIEISVFGYLSARESLVWKLEI